MIVLDTHVLVWLDEGNERLGKKARQRINSALNTEELFVSAISFWEIAMLNRKGRLELHIEIDVWRRELLDSGLQEIPVSGAIAIRAGSFIDFHGDPADRLIVASALENSASLVTADEKILHWKRLPAIIDARQ